MPTTSSSAGSPTSTRVPISPFSRSPTGDGASTSSSQYTSDEQPDLGAFQAVFREWGYLQSLPRLLLSHNRSNGRGLGRHTNWTTTSMSATGTISGTETNEDSTTWSAGMSGTASTDWSSAEERYSTVWNQDLVADYLRSSAGAATMTMMTTTTTPRTTVPLSRDSLWWRDVDGRGVNVASTDDNQTHNDSNSDDGTEGARSVVIEITGDYPEHDTDIVVEAEETGDEDLLKSPSLLKSVVDEASTNYTSTLSPLKAQVSLLDVGDSSPVPEGPEVELDELDIGLNLGVTPDGEPSLGYLDQALKFIAAERAKLDAQRAVGLGFVTGGRKHPLVQYQRTRTTASPVINTFTSGIATAPASSSPVISADENDNHTGEHYGTSLTPRKAKLYFKSRSKSKAISTPGSPKHRTDLVISGSSSSEWPVTLSQSARNHPPAPITERKARVIFKRKKRRVDTTIPLRTLTRARSAPSLAARQGQEVIAIEVEDAAEEEGLEEETPTRTRREGNKASDSRGEVRRLRELAKEMKRMFPVDREGIGHVERRLMKERVEEGEADPRGRPPREGDTLVHVFIDYSNILIGLLMYLKRHPNALPRSLAPPDHKEQALKPQKRIEETTDEEGIMDCGVPMLKPSKLRFSQSTETVSSPLEWSSSSSKEVAASSMFWDPASTGTGKTSLAVPSSSSTTSHATIKPGTIGIASPSPTTMSSQRQPSSTHIQGQKQTPIPLPSFAIAAKILTTGGAQAAGVETSRNGQESGDTRRGGLGLGLGVVGLGLRPYPMLRSASDDVLVFEGPEQNSKKGAGGDGGGGRLDSDERGESGYDDGGAGREGDYDVKEMKPRQMWHTALAFILERGRPITRRVCVTSSPLYQPMDAMERLGYEVRIFMRVPDLGDGMDRKERQMHRRNESRGPKVRAGRISGNAITSVDGYIGTTSSEDGVPKGGPSRDRGPASMLRVTPPSSVAGAADPITLTSSAPVSGNGGGGGGGGSKRNLNGQGRQWNELFLSRLIHSSSSSGMQVHPPQQHHHQQKIRYREQGVDELLQLKLHQAIADTDDIPEGATIVLATGDGNAGQFSEDGFLGPVRTALRRGWRVELYAWEDGLSRAWRKEFGAGSEWEQSGMFRIINMEPFAAFLVKDKVF